MVQLTDIQMVLVVLALICFVLATLNVSLRLNLTAAGLALVTLALMGIIK